MSEQGFNKEEQERLELLLGIVMTAESITIDHVTELVEILSGAVSLRNAEVARLKVAAQQLRAAYSALDDRRINMEADVSFLVVRAGSAGRCEFGGERDYGASSNAIVRLAYGGEPPNGLEMPFDESDLAACELAVEHLPEHRKSDAVQEALERARAALRRRK